MKTARNLRAVWGQDFRYISDERMKRKYAKPAAKRRNSTTRSQPATAITLGSIPTKKETPKPTTLKIRSVRATDLRALSSSMVLPNQLSKPGTTRLAPSNCATKFILALKDTVVPTVRPKRLRIVLGASNNPAARISMTIIWTINKIRNFIRSSSLLYKFKSCLQDTTFLIPFQAPQN